MKNAATDYVEGRRRRRIRAALRELWALTEPGPFSAATETALVDYIVKCEIVSERIGRTASPAARRSER